MLNENSIKVSVIGLIRKKLKCLNTKLVMNPKNNPIVSDTIPNMKNSPTISKGVNQAN
jgi:hypothetical protein